MVTEREQIEKALQACLKEQDTRIGIYGTGKGADAVYQVLQDLLCADRLQLIIDNDASMQIGTEKYGKKVCKLKEAVDSVDLIVIGARIYHFEVAERVERFCRDHDVAAVVLDPFAHNNSVEDKLQFLEYLEEMGKKEHSQFFDIAQSDFQRRETDVKLIAWYLPQYYEIEVNNHYYGKGFTEWTNVTQTMPQFCGHYQPQIPYDVGFYTLTNPEVLQRQTVLARKYGIYGFSFYYYWFSGQRIMEKPLQLFLEHKEIQMPFCLTWANENWTSKWDEGSNEIIYEQRLRKEDDGYFMEDILPLLKDGRYITIDGKPLLIIYRSDMFCQERFCDMLGNFRRIAAENGFPGLYIMITTAVNSESAAEKWGADAFVELPPHGVAKHSEYLTPKGYLNPNFRGIVRDAAAMIESRSYLAKPKGETIFRGVMTSFDNTPRKGMTGATIFYGLKPSLYKRWLKDVLLESKENHRLEENFVFINAWNEWAEGAHLEPDIKYGYAYLQATMEALEEVRE